MRTVLSFRRFAILLLHLLFVRWPERRAQRRELADLPAGTLADIGLTREQALFEARKPFWR